MPYADPARQTDRYQADPERFRQRARDAYARNPGPARERARQTREQARAAREATQAAARRETARVAGELRRTVPAPVPYRGDVSWQDRAACAGMDVEAFFEQHVPPEVKAACLACPVRAECLGMVLSFATTDAVGMWGGTTAQDRFRLRREARARDTDVTHERTAASGG